MKTQNTLENKAKFFAQYWKQDVLCRVIFGKNKNEIIMHNTPCSNLKLGEIIDSYLELKPLSQIGDEDAIKVSKIFGLGHLQGAVKELILSIFRTSINDSGTTSSTNGIKNWLQVFDYLRSKGYALPWMDLSVEDLVEYGWVKLKEN